MLLRHSTKGIPRSSFVGGCQHQGLLDSFRRDVRKSLLRGKGQGSSAGKEQ